MSVVLFKSANQETAGYSRKPNNNKPQPISSEKIVETLLDLHAKHELNPRHLEKDHANILNALIKVTIINVLCYPCCTVYRSLLTILISQISLIRQLKL